MRTHRHLRWIVTRMPRVSVALAITLTIAASLSACGSSGSAGTGADASASPAAGFASGAVNGGFSATATPATLLAPPVIATALQLPQAALAPAALIANDVTLLPTDATPLVTQEQAMQVIADRGIPWAFGGEWDGKPVTVSAAYGLATFGFAGPNGGWSGERNIPLPSGEVLDHIEQRPMWIIDYENTVFYAAGCPECPPPPDYNHAVYAVDAETSALWFVWPYVGN